MFEGFALERIEVNGVGLRVRHGGSGPPLLLIHGCPQTHMMWGKIADELAKEFTVVAPDLRGYGGSDKPAPGEKNVNYSKRTMAQDALGLMRHLGFARFDVAAHDRGGRVGYRLALDHPQAVRRVSILDIVPTGELWDRLDAKSALGYWHWQFLAQPSPGPETAIGHDPEAFFFDFMFRGSKDMFEPEAYADYVASLKAAETVRGVCEDYRAGAGIDRRIDREDMSAGRKIACPVQVLWGAKGAVGAWYDVMDVWGRWADDLTGQALDCGHFVPEEQPEATLAALQAFHRA